MNVPYRAESASMFVYLTATDHEVYALDAEGTVWRQIKNRDLTPAQIKEGHGGWVLCNMQRYSKMPKFPE